MQTKQVIFLAADTTKGALVFQEHVDGVKVKGDEAVVGTLYVRKVAVNGQPKVVRATIEFFDSPEEMATTEKVG